MNKIIKLVFLFLALIVLSSCDKEEDTDTRMLKTYVAAASNYHVEDEELACSVLKSSEELAQFLASREIDRANPIYAEVNLNDFSRVILWCFFPI